MWSESEGEGGGGGAGGGGAGGGGAGGGGAGGAALALAPAGGPRVEHLSVSNKSRVHVGSNFNFVSVTQHVRNTDVVQGRVLGLALEASVARKAGGARAQAGGGAGGGAGDGAGDERRVRCSVAVCVCWTLGAAAALALYALCRALPARPVRIDLDITEAWYLRRGDWQAMPAYGSPAAQTRGAPYALVGHSATPRCEGRSRCIRAVLAIQSAHQRMGWDDIGPNFLVSGDGLVFEGRGAGVVGAMTAGWNARSVSVMFVGDYRLGRDAPTAVQMARVRALLAALRRAGALAAQYVVRAHCQVAPRTYSPGRRVLEQLHTLDHWDRADVSACLQM